MSAAVVCPACHETVLPDALVIANWRLDYTWLGDRMKWTHPAFGLIHLCDPTRRAYVMARDPRVVAHPPWVRVLFRFRLLRPFARRVPAPVFLPRVLILPAEVADADPS